MGRKHGSIYCAPHDANKVLKINPATQIATVVGPDIAETNQTNMWIGAETGGDGCVYMIPHHANQVRFWND